MRNIRRLIFLKVARKLGRGSSGPVPGIISEGTKIKGNITSNGILHIDGKVEGDINCDELIIGVKGNVLGTVTANNLMLYGTLQGMANAGELFIARTAKLFGDAAHNTIAVEPGAYIDGRCQRKAGSVKIEQTEADLKIAEKAELKEHKEPTLS